MKNLTEENIKIIYKALLTFQYTQFQQMKKWSQQHQDNKKLFKNFNKFKDYMLNKLTLELKHIDFMSKQGMEIYIDNNYTLEFQSFLDSFLDSK